MPQRALFISYCRIARSAADMGTDMQRRSRNSGELSFLTCCYAKIERLGTGAVCVFDLCCEWCGYTTIRRAGALAIVFQPQWRVPRS